MARTRTQGTQADNATRIKALEKAAKTRAQADAAPAKPEIAGIDELMATVATLQARLDVQEQQTTSLLSLVEGQPTEVATREVSASSARSQAQQRSVATDDLDEAIAAVPIPTGVSTTSAQRIRRVAKGNPDAQAAYDGKLTGKSPRRDYFEACMAARGSLA